MGVRFPFSPAPPRPAPAPGPSPGPGVGRAGLAVMAATPLALGWPTAWGVALLAAGATYALLRGLSMKVTPARDHGEGER